MKNVKHLKLEVNLNEERQMLSDLVAPYLQERFNISFSSIKGRMKFIQKLNHHDCFNSMYEKKIDSTDDTVDEILNMLERKKAPKNCYVISTNYHIDGKRMLLKEALVAIHGNQQGSIICCIPGKLLYYEGEYKKRYIIEKNI